MFLCNNICKYMLLGFMGMKDSLVRRRGMVVKYNGFWANVTVGDDMYFVEIPRNGVGTGRIEAPIITYDVSNILSEDILQQIKDVVEAAETKNR